MIVLFGGSFDPVHEGHCHLAKELLKKFQFEKLYFVPAKRNPLKPNGTTASPEQRFHMLRLSIEEMHEPRFEVLDCEIKRDGPSYTVDTLRELSKQHKDISLIIGNELLATFSQWKSPDEILKLAQLIIVTRNSDATTEPPKGSKTVDIQPLPYSSTMLRAKIKEKFQQGELETSPQGIQRSVWLFIKENRLYCR